MPLLPTCLPRLLALASGFMGGCWLMAQALTPLAVSATPAESIAMNTLAQSPAATALIPLPQQQTVRPGHFRLEASTQIVASGGAEKSAQTLAESLRLPTGFPLSVVAEMEASSAIVLKLDNALEKTLGREGYLLEVTTNQVVLKAAAEAGLFYGAATLRQLLPPEVFHPGPVTAPSQGWIAPCVEIQDAPRFGWRGILLDVARHFMPVEDVKKFIDTMAGFKLNVLQLHLTDDQGWRIEIKKYPRLTEVGASRKESPRRGDRNQGDGQPYGPFFYTQAQLRELVAYAQARHVTIVPEIEFPGHVMAVLAAYPEYACTDGPFSVRTSWGIDDDILCMGNDKAVPFAQDVLAEVLAIFPSKFVHIGGDEAPRTRWKKCPRCQQRMKSEGFTEEAQLQSWLNHRLEAFLSKHGRRMIGWDEILEGGLAPGATVMSWRGIEGGIAAATAGHDVVMSPTTHCYLDYAQGKEASEPESIGGFLPVDKVYSFEPVPPGLPLDKQHHILGGQGNLWTEYIHCLREAEYFVYPRAAALAEILWSPATGRDFASFKQRAAVQQLRLDQLGVNYRRLDP